MERLVQPNGRESSLWGSGQLFRRWGSVRRAGPVISCFQPLMDEWRRKLQLGLKQDSTGIHPIKPQRKYIVYDMRHFLWNYFSFFLLLIFRAKDSENRIDKDTDMKDQKWQRSKRNIKLFMRKIKSWTGFWRALASLLLIEKTSKVEKTSIKD